MALIATLVDTLIIEITTAKFNGIAKSIKKYDCGWDGTL